VKYLKNQKKECTSWLIKLYKEKEDLLEYFKENQCFPGKGNLYRENYWDLSLTALFSFIVWYYTGYYWWFYLPKLFYGAILLNIFAVSFLIWYDLKHQSKLFRESKKE